MVTEVEQFIDLQAGGENNLPTHENADHKTCRKCGECCKRGGPALHRQDGKLIEEGKIPLTSLITIRKGELVQDPLAGGVRPASVELVKIIGTGNQWQCSFYDHQDGCTIYSCRPVACSLLQCWDTRRILDIVERDTLCRLDIVKTHHPLAALIKKHDRLCPCTDLARIQTGIDKLTGDQKADLQALVRRDLDFRAKVAKDFNLSLALELFYFGRPLFQLLQPFGVKTVESVRGIVLIWPS
ncbi:MAG: YkgJ family cysteine cluster protein [Desulforhopalus sp.]